MATVWQRVVEPLKRAVCVPRCSPSNNRISARHEVDVYSCVMTRRAAKRVKAQPTTTSTTRNDAQRQAATRVSPATPRVYAINQSTATCSTTLILSDRVFAKSCNSQRSDDVQRQYLVACADSRYDISIFKCQIDPDFTQFSLCTAL